MTLPLPDLCWCGHGWNHHSVNFISHRCAQCDSSDRVRPPSAPAAVAPTPVAMVQPEQLEALRGLQERQVVALECIAAALERAFPPDVPNTGPPLGDES